MRRVRLHRLRRVAHRTGRAPCDHAGAGGAAAQVRGTRPLGRRTLRGEVSAGPGTGPGRPADGGGGNCAAGGLSGPARSRTGRAASLGLGAAPGHASEAASPRTGFALLPTLGCAGKRQGCAQPGRPAAALATPCSAMPCPALCEMLVPKCSPADLNLQKQNGSRGVSSSS